MGFEHQPLWSLTSFMDTFTRISERILCEFKWIFMAISIGFEHQEYLNVYYANLNGFWASTIMGSDRFYGHLLEYRSLFCATFNGFSWQFQLVFSIKNIRVFCKFIWGFMVVSWKHLLKYPSVHHANLNGFSKQFFLLLLSIKNIEEYIMKFKWVFQHQEYRSVYYANLNGFSCKLFIYLFLFFLFASDTQFRSYVSIPVVSSSHQEKRKTVLGGKCDAIVDTHYRVLNKVSFHSSNKAFSIILCKLKWVFMAILIGFEHKEYRSVYWANLNGFSW